MAAVPHFSHSKSGRKPTAEKQTCAVEGDAAPRTSLQERRGVPEAAHAKRTGSLA